MNIEEYISSGILELYVLRQLPADETKEVEEMAARYPEVRKELSLIEEAMEVMAQKTSIVPDLGTKDLIFAKIDHKNIDRSDAEPSPLTLTPSTASSSGFRRIKFVLAASIALTALSSIVAVTYWNKWQDSQRKLQETENELNELITQNQQIAQNFHKASNELEKLQSDFEIARSQNYQQIQMEGLAIAPSAVANIYWSANTKEVYLDVESLPETPTDKQFQLWAIVDGKPVDAGVFDINGRIGLKKMKDISNASAFAVTLEPRGGSESPTMDLMYVYGEVKKG